MIDWDRAALLRDELGAEGFDEVAVLFLEEVQARVDHLAAHPDRRAEDMHFLKGSAWNLGFAALAAFCEAGEGGTAPEDAARPLDVAELRRIWDASCAMFRAGTGRQGGADAA